MGVALLLSALPFLVWMRRLWLSLIEDNYVFGFSSPLVCSIFGSFSQISPS